MGGKNSGRNRKGTAALADQVDQLKRQLEKAQRDVRYFRSQGVNLELELVRQRKWFEQESKNRQLEADGLRAQNSALMERIVSVLRATEIKES